MNDRDLMIRYRMALEAIVLSISLKTAIDIANQALREQLKNGN